MSRRVRLDRDTRKKNITKIITGLVTAPGSTFGTLAENPRGYWNFALVVFSILALSSAFTSWLPLELDDLTGLNTIVSFPINMALMFQSAVAFFITYAVIMWVGNRLSERRANFRTIFVVLTCAAIPPLLVEIPLVILSYLVADLAILAILAPASIAVFVWAIVLAVKGTKAIYGFGTAKSFGLLLLGALAGAIALFPSYLLLGL